MQSTPPESHVDRHQRQTAEIYEALGRFVASFEALVNEVRHSILMQLTSSGSQQPLMNIVLHHPSMTAKPLFDIFQSIIGQVIKDAQPSFEPVSVETLRSIVRQLASDYEGLTKTRNLLVHGTWFVGFGSSPEDDFSEFMLAKGNANKDGFAYAADYPKSAQELLVAAAKAQEATDLIMLVHMAISPFRIDLTKNTIRENGRWKRRPPSEPRPI